MREIEVTPSTSWDVLYCELQTGFSIEKQVNDTVNSDKEHDVDYMPETDESSSAEADHSFFIYKKEKGPRKAVYAPSAAVMTTLLSC